jgi:hypothetical protein
MDVPLAPGSPFATMEALPSDPTQPLPKQLQDQLRF